MMSKPRCHPHQARHALAARQRGAATLVVVMILFFIMAMMAAYANRNLIFEQRIASNYYRVGVATEIADGGTEWALAMLNSGNIDGSCGAGAAATQRFVDRYLLIDPQTGTISPRTEFGNRAVITGIAAGAVRRVNGSWDNFCPAAGAWAVPAIAASSQMQPSFGIYVMSAGGANRPGVLRIVSMGCTDSNAFLCTSGNQATASAQLLGGVNVTIQAALVSALKMPPATPLTTGQGVSDGAGALGLHNSDPNAGGLLLVAGGTVGGTELADDRLESLPGTPGRQALVSQDQTLSTALANSRMFQLFFGMPMQQYQDQPAIRQVPCNGDCSADLLAAVNAGARMIWVNGPLTLNTNNVYGSATNPVVLVANGQVTINSPLVFHGLIYAAGPFSWTNNSGQPARLNGAAISEGAFSAVGTVDLVYDADIINRLSKATGSFVRLPGSWWDTY